MPKFTFTITPENEKWLREQNRKKGDMSQILNDLMRREAKEDERKKDVADELKRWKTYKDKKEAERSRKKEK